ncbi:MAG: L-threonylcarbamoyladenylate synthase [Gordonia sp. (in: high G+C Gram-positive bacteria)]|uniref:L-threonylcarbamoyladenylate synthase n=1 Tax=Gordonia sp. (in: high G+C Gram-positive bacteria) TaxID=84139 RepID=UPI0039E697D3
MSVVYDCSDPQERAAGMRAAVGAARGGRLVVMPTDTLYGIGCDAFDSEAVASLLEAKHRGRDMPVPVLVGSWQTIDGLVQRVSPEARELVQSFWPGGLSLVVEQAPSLAWDLGDADGTVMLRMPLHPVAVELLREVGPMAVSSANVSGGQPSATLAQARDQLGDSVAVYLDGGPADHAVASTIVDLTGESPLVLREGAVSLDEVAEVLDMTPDELRLPQPESE